MAEDETPKDEQSQDWAGLARYSALYPSIRERLKTIRQSSDPRLRAMYDRLDAMMARGTLDRRAALAERFGLTPAEVRLASVIAAGGRLGDYAAQQGVSLGTVRTHLKAVFAKTGVHRQSELVRLFNSASR